MALGLLMCGRDSVPFNKLRVDLAFEAAWRDWAYRDRFSQVNTGLRNGSPGSSVMSRANERKQVWNLYWDSSGGELVVYAHGQSENEDIDLRVVACSIDGDVPPAGWRALAEDFLERFER